MFMRSLKQTFLVALSTLATAGALFAADKPAKAPAKGDVIKEPTTEAAKAGPLSFTAKDIDGKEVKLSDFKGKVVLFVNVASKCGNTPQYKPLEAMYEKYKEQGLVVVGFPANEFNKQEPGTDAQIKEFCQATYKVAFPMMSKVVVKGEGIHPLYQYLTDSKTNGDFAGDIQWNFQKFIVDRNGNTIARISPKTQPDDPKVIAAIEKALAAKPAK